MKKLTKILVALLVLATFVGIFAAMPTMAASEYKAIKIKTAQVTVGHYTNTALTGDIVQHCAAPNYKEEAACLVDNDNGSAFWSKPYKFSALKDNGGSTVPVILVDVANGGEPATIAAMEMMLRSAFDCQILHFELQATTAADSNNWVKVLEKNLSVNNWDSRKLRFEFSEITVYKVRLLVYDIADCDIAKDDYKEYTVCLGDETRFTLAEFDLLEKKETSSNDGGSSTTKPTTSVQATTRPAFNFPTATTKPTTPAATTKPTTPVATAKPTTPAATTAPTTPVATAKPTTGTTVAPTTPVATNPAVSDPTTLVTTPTETLPVDATTPTVDATVEPSDPIETVDPSAPVTEPVADPEYLTYEVVDEGAVITAVDTAALTGVFTIPETLGGYPVTAIGDNAFAGVELTEITFEGTEAQWQQITVGAGNDVLTSATITYQGEEATEPVTEPTEPVTEPETEPATEPEATTPTTDNGDEGDNSGNTTTIIIIAIVAAVIVAGVVVFFIIRKKKAA